MALIREKRLPQLQLSLPVPPRAAGQRPNPMFAPAPPAPTPKKASTPTALSSQFRLSDFDKLAVLGRGSGGTVYKVRHRETCALYALKVQHYGDPTAAAEAEILSRTASPLVVRCHSVLPAAGSGDVAMLLELVDGGSLDSIKSRQGAFPEAALAEVAAQALSGLAYLHARRIVHLDIKPANVLASMAGEVKIADFGIAKVLSRAGDQSTSYVGTTAYMSPERFDPEAHGGQYDPYAADVWSLGVTILELFMGRYPLLPAGQKPNLVHGAAVPAAKHGQLVEVGEAELAGQGRWGRSFYQRWCRRRRERWLGTLVWGGRRDGQREVQLWKPLLPYESHT
ncbi:mitogen-activated protein kinase kinase 9-like [Lolium rigidum]|uniref:mitogen-activated protein kinase kinase 9-like n=1 Tax=Lolium rigidum TaxID=89674 RepID=UPI001F5DE35A|nr:mitogen-activated protein kinase kinase 9-like [Lolium rigidum]